MFSAAIIGETKMDAVNSLCWKTSPCFQINIHSKLFLIPWEVSFLLCQFFFLGYLSFIAEKNPSLGFDYNQNFQGRVKKTLLTRCFLQALSQNERVLRTWKSGSTLTAPKKKTSKKPRVFFSVHRSLSGPSFQLRYGLMVQIRLYKQLIW